MIGYQCIALTTCHVTAIMLVLTLSKELRLESRSPQNLTSTNLYCFPKSSIATGCPPNTNERHERNEKQI